MGKETRLPTALRNAMQDCEAFLFLGFDCENWYLRVLFHILKFSEKTRLVFGLPEGASDRMPGATEAFFRHQFKFSFLQDKPVELLQGIRARIESGQAGGPSATTDGGRDVGKTNRCFDMNTELRTRYPGLSSFTTAQMSRCASCSTSAPICCTLWTN